MSLESDIAAASKKALTDGDKPRRSILTYLHSEIIVAGINKRVDTLSDPDTITVLQKQKKRCQETLDAAISGNREVLFGQALYEIGVIDEFLPAALSADQVALVVGEVIAELNATSIKDMGRVMIAASTRLTGVDKAELSKAVKQKLS